MPPAVVVGAAVSGGRDEENPGVARGTYCIFKCFRLLRRTPAGVDHAKVHTVLFTVDRVIDRLDGILRRTETAAAKKLQRHYLNGPVDPGDPFAVVPFGADDT